MRPLTPELLLRAYASGIFPMARSREDDKLYWIDPDQRGVLPLDNFHLPRSLRKTLRRGIFEVRCDTAFEQVMRLCAEPSADRSDTWINDEIVRLFCELHMLGLAHSVESWRDGELVGGLYGLSLGTAFFGESMFSRATDASKVALVHLVARLRRGGYTLLDTQFVTEHLERFGAREISRHAYLQQLARAMDGRATFYCELDCDWEEALSQPITQIS
ncbi:leucyl/phenylalanyl-tRNA--protein transferase [Telmatospirillum sp. J64-1]|uniref:leucyl/phenylalanyl-tRNA--protein transferase n=1 Tax=Telmatospirillum sp. J64-1 TaxID=2502183 RepID=UPI00115F733E|nr:leucyl/phenylalanyl-tRNA--protein transferase [Telmatospirillum sp. J64-1]